MAFRYRGSFSRTDQTARLMAWPVAASQTIKKGMLLDLSSGKAAKASAGSSAVLGVAAHDISTGSVVTSDDKVLVYIDPEAIFEVDYTGSVKESLADSDLGTAFDITSDADAIDLDDTDDGMCIVVGYDNDAATAMVKIAAGSRALT